MKKPFVGLRPFKSSEGSLFHGRVKETQILTNLALTLPALVVYAPSGTGKSSLINAGLKGCLEQEGQDVVIIDATNEDPVYATRQALSHGSWSKTSDADLATILNAHWLATDQRVVLIIDQFEERFNAGQSSEDLYDAIAKLWHQNSDAACIVISIREDYLGGLEPLMRRVPNLLSASYRVPSLSREALRLAVYGPIREVDDRIKIDNSLVEQVLNDLNAKTSSPVKMGDQKLEPGYFQIVWSTMWNSAEGSKAELTFDKYVRLGRADKILKDFTRSILDQLEPVQKDVFWAIARYLVLPTGAKTALTIDDLVKLLQPSDFPLLPVDARESSASNAVRSWVKHLPTHTYSEVIRSIFRELTSTRAPLFQRVMRGQREEFEFLHDLLGSILLEWRTDYPRITGEAVSRPARTIEREAQQIVREIQKERDDPNGARLLKSTTNSMRSLSKNLETKGVSERTVDQFRNLILLVTVNDALSWNPHYYGSRRADVQSYVRHRNALIAAAARASIQHKDQRDRRVDLQWALATYNYIERPLPVSPVDPFPARRAAVAALAAWPISFLSMGLAYFCFATYAPQLQPHYAVITLPIVASALWILYGMSVFFLTRGNRSWLSSVMAVLFPGAEIWERLRARKRITIKAQFSSLWTWPMPAFGMQGLMFIGSWISTKLIDTPTPGYNLAALAAVLCLPVIIAIVAS